MTTYSLEIQFDLRGLAAPLAAAEQVVIVKQTSPSVEPVVWVAFDPLLVNAVTWTDEYSVYGSRSGLEEDGVIGIDWILPAVGGETYLFQDGQFGSWGANLPSNEYGIGNLDQNFMLLTAGLAQASSGSGGDAVSALNAIILPFNDEVVFTPSEVVQVFTLANATNGRVISSVPSDALLVDLTENTSQVIQYSDDNGQFVLGPLPLPSARSGLPDPTRSPASGLC